MTSTRPTSSTAPSRYILDNLVGEVRLSAAAELIGMSESAFSKYFKRMSGQTFSDTVRKLRLAQAGKLLKDTDLPVGLDLPPGRLREPVQLQPAVPSPVRRHPARVPPPEPS